MPQGVESAIASEVVSLEASVLLVPPLRRGHFDVVGWYDPYFMIVCRRAS